MTFDISSMLNPEVYDHPVESIELIETHISWVLLTGNFAYKIKKPVNFGFLDFSTLEKRHTFCEQELRLNRRLAAAIYLDVVSISGSEDKPVISANGEGFEYAVKMVQFPQSSQLDHMLAAGELDAGHMDAIAHMVAGFHQAIQITDDSMDYGSKDTVYRPVEENFIQISEHFDTGPYADTLSTLRQWSRSEFVKLEPMFAQRKQNGFVRECHGDMHLRNLIWLDGRPMAFDCIEFNPALRWIDVISEVAFLVMDLQDRQQHLLANRFLNAYLEDTGDYAGLSVLPFYLCYRALVRAKVDVLYLEQKKFTEEQRQQSLAELKSYLELASGYTQPPAPKLIIMRGVSASGKSSVSQTLVDVLGAIRLRSDVERKRLFDITLTDSASNGIDEGIYSPQASQQTYAKLAALAADVIRAGYSVIVDATFMQHEQRQPFQVLADHMGIPYIILETTAPAGVLRQRIVERRHDISDAGPAVLEHQLSNWRPLHEDEMHAAISVNTAQVLQTDALIDKLNEFRCT
ncbi:MAG: bifunctional aminoglycoside phosphotransferase/ATP-binding protein [Gammaproteobacteria bacterium]|nr:MAG: bifunctional aminoglycoside phosphotransferase/ATP-binding protein [Gammaproteobacteria bacterium]